MSSKEKTDTIEGRDNPMQGEIQVDRTAMTLQTRYGDYSVTVKRSDMTLDELLEEIVRPLLVAAGYSPELVEEYFSE